MCGIAGFSLSKNSNINAQALAHALLCSIEDRGYMASGYAYQEIDGSISVHKGAVTGSLLSVAGLPEDASNVILHTRLATHGSIDVNDNNHPVWSPNKGIALVHNGVIHNHHQVRAMLTDKLPEVDTSVIPALLESGSTDMLDNLSGDAAIAWFDVTDPNRLHLARYQWSPLVTATLEDGSFLFCSTEALLWEALIALDIMPESIQSAKELDYFIIEDGMVVSKTTLPKPKSGSYGYDNDYFRYQTSGAKGGFQYSPSAWLDEDDDDYVYAPPVVMGRSVLGLSDDEYAQYEEDQAIEENMPMFWAKIHHQGEYEQTEFFFKHEESLWQHSVSLSQEAGVLVDYGRVETTLVSALDTDDTF